MTAEELIKLKFPIGKFQKPEMYTETLNQENIKVIRDFPKVLKKMVDGLKEEQLNWVYRPNGWSIKQVVHHCADSHMNAFIRFKLALTEDNPVIKPYDQAAWALLSDAKDFGIESSLNLLSGLHSRFAEMLSGLNTQNLDKTFTHPEWNKHLPLKMNLSLYAWHSKHHTAHIKNAIISKGKYQSK